jgi:hypothetical protein
MVKKDLMRRIEYAPTIHIPDNLCDYDWEDMERAIYKEKYDKKFNIQVEIDWHTGRD